MGKRGLNSNSFLKRIRYIVLANCMNLRWEQMWTDGGLPDTNNNLHDRNEKRHDADEKMC